MVDAMLELLPNAAVGLPLASRPATTRTATTLNCMLSLLCPLPPLLIHTPQVHHIGMYRMKGSDIPVQYYNRLPKHNVADVSFVLDPLIASGR